MSRLIQSLASVGSRYQAVFCDLWGCLHDGKSPFPSAVAALQAYRATGGKVVLMTNAPRPNGQVIAQLDRMGVPRACYDLVVSSGDATQYALVSGTVGTKVWHLGPDKDKSFFTELPPDITAPPAIDCVALDDAEGIVCTGPFDDMVDVPEDYRGRFLLAKARGLPMLCANPDLVVDYGDKRIYCAGALAALYQDMGGTVFYYGKPHPPIYDLARARSANSGPAIPDSAILAIGDGIGTDIQGGIAEDIDTLFVTSGLSADHFGPEPDCPDVNLLTRWLAGQQLAPTYSIGRLR